MTYTPSDTFTNKMINVLGNWIDPCNITAVSAVEGCPQESEYFFILTFKHGGAIEIETDSAVEIDDAHDTVMQAWDTAVQRECLEEQFERRRSRDFPSPTYTVEYQDGIHLSPDPIDKDELLKLQRRVEAWDTLTANTPADTPSDTIKQEINQASKAVLERIDDVGGGV
jgi:hypothetical protein